jgi:hypothetical protein
MWWFLVPLNTCGQMLNVSRRDLDKNFVAKEGFSH